MSSAPSPFPGFSTAAMDLVWTAGSRVSALLEFEAALAQALADAGVAPTEEAEAVAAACRRGVTDPERILMSTWEVGTPLIALLDGVRGSLTKDEQRWLHHEATSQDAIDTALVLRLRAVLDLFARRLADLAARLDELGIRFGDRPLMGRTRMQAALPITVGQRINAWSRPLHDLSQLSDALRARVLRLQLGGPVGTLDAFGDRGPAVRRRLAAALGLADAPQWQTDRGALADLAHWLSRLCGSLGKLGADVALMAQQLPAEVGLSGGGGSSAMPHKSNPVRAEVLVALARYAATLLPAMHHALLHEQERSGAAWTLEWLALPQLLLATGGSLRSAAVLLDNIQWLGNEGETRVDG